MSAIWRNLSLNFLDSRVVTLRISLHFSCRDHGAHTRLYHCRDACRAQGAYRARGIWYADLGMHIDLMMYFDIGMHLDTGMHLDIGMHLDVGMHLDIFLGIHFPQITLKD